MKRFIASRFVFGLAVGVGAWLVAAVGQADPVVSSGFDPAADLKGAVRYRQLNNTGSQRVKVGPSSDIAMDPAPSSVATASVAWGANNSFSITYNAAAGSLSTTVNGGTVTNSALGDLGLLNYLQITIVRPGMSPPALNLNGVVLQPGGHNLNDFMGAGSPTRWMVTGADLTDGFTLSGTLQRGAGNFGGGDSSHVQIDVGHVAAPDEDGPITSDVTVQPDPVILNGNATVTANVDDSTTGGSTIASAHYQLDAGAIVSMSASDGGFDEVSEDVEATFLATEVGTREVCVHGTDEHNNDGDQTCQTFLVTYQFDGFFSPIETDLLNVAKAGQAVPAKWRLTDANGAPIDTASSFVGLFSYSVNCDDFAGSPTDAIEEEPSGASGLQWFGNGYWQFNWKTLKTYANTCRAMYVEFDSGAISPVVKFQFKK